ncbi:hypothetical protein ACE6H2_001489 [Prunus campanulata]
MAKINANAFCTSVLCSICIIINLSVFILFASITFGSLLKSECVLYIRLMFIILNIMFLLYGNIIELVTALFFLVENLLLERFDFVGD